MVGADEGISEHGGGLAEKIFTREMGGFDTLEGEPFTRFYGKFHTDQIELM